MTLTQAEAHVDRLYGPHWREPTQQERQANPMRGPVWDTAIQDPAWPYQDRQTLVDAFTTQNPTVCRVLSTLSPPIVKARG